MQVGISTASLFLKKSNKEAVALLRDWKIPVAEVFFTTFREYNGQFGGILKEAKGDVKINSVHVLTEQFEPQLYSRHPQVREDAFLWLKGVMEAAQLLHAEYYTFHGAARIKRRGNYDNFDFYSPLTGEIYDFCKRYGVTLAYENVEWALYNRPGVFGLLKKSCPGLKGVLDVKQARVSGYDYRDYVADMGPSLAYVHYSDADRNGNTCLAGKGIFDTEEMIKVLRDAGFDGNILIENYASDYKALEELKESYLYLCEKVYKLEKR